MTSSQHPAAKLFPAAALRLVAAGDAFGYLPAGAGEYRRYSDGRDLLAALLGAAGLAGEMRGTTAGGVFAARLLGLLPATGDTPMRAPRKVEDLCDLGRRGDRGEYKTAAALRQALLGATD